jgi:16S rRNA (guanine1207-N2)-methyltransferase
MDPTSQVVLRNAAGLPDGSLLLVNPPRDGLYSSLTGMDRTVRVSTQDHGDYRYLAGGGADVRFEVLPAQDQSLGAVIMNLPREKARFAMMLHALGDWLPDTVPLWVVGENTAGIKSAGRHLGAFFKSVGKRDAARHCGLFEASAPIRARPFDLADYVQTWSVRHHDQTVNLISLPGVFAHGRLDSGSRLLLHSLEHLNPSGRILDFACGSGVIGIAVLRRDPGIRLTLLDSSALALESAHRSLQANGMQAERVASDGLSGLHGRFDWILSNPPFHRGVKNELEISARFFQCAGTFLSQNGKILIVCNRHLPYLKWLSRHFSRVSKLDGNHEYDIILASEARG